MGGGRRQSKSLAAHVKTPQFAEPDSRFPIPASRLPLNVSLPILVLLLQALYYSRIRERGGVAQRAALGDVAQ